jgi:hypothetical protein
VEVAVVEGWLVDLNRVLAFDLGKILLEHNLQPPQVAASIILKKLRETPRQLRYSAVKMRNVS